MPPKIVPREVGGQLVLELPPDLREPLRAAGPLQVALASREALVLLSEASGADGFWAGSLNTVSLGELFGQLIAQLRSGLLVIASEGQRRAVSFANGEVIFASSTAPHQRVGELMVRTRMVTQAQLDEALREVKPGVKVGQVLTRRGFLSANDLYGALTYLVREIVLDLFWLEQGQFVFLENAPPPANHLKLADPTKALVLEGIKRGEQVSRMRQRFVDHAVLESTGKPSLAQGAALVEAAEDGATVKQLRQRFGGSEYQFLCLLDELVAAGSLVKATKTVVPAAAPASADLPRMEPYQVLLQRICVAFARGGGDLSTMRAFISEPMPALTRAYQGVSMSDSGEVDVERIAYNCAGPNVRGQVLEALDALVAYSLFTLRNQVPPMVSEALVEEYQRVRADQE